MGFLRGAGDRPVKADIVHEIFLRVVERGIHLGDLLGQLGAVLLGGTFGGECGDVGFEDQARLEHLGWLEAVERTQNVERRSVERCGAR